MKRVGSMIFRDAGGYRCFSAPSEMILAHAYDAVLPALDAVEQHVQQGRYAAGFIAYEAAPAFDPVLHVHTVSDQPLVCFGIYDACTTAPPECPVQRPQPPEEWKAQISEAEYRNAVHAIREHIAAGDSYQVNYTFPLETSFEGDPLAWFLHLSQAQGTGYHAFLDLGDTLIVSASPELFFELDGDQLRACPMKGTRPRGRWYEEDQAMQAELRASEKERAENIMIVDMLRNDMGRISRTGSVRVPEQFTIEAYPTVWQMTSTITSETDAALPEIFWALFPCASVTGAPKVETMKIIHALEPHPRGVYCGAIGWVAPNRQAQFNVAIRTATINRKSGTTRYHVGSGITWDSAAQAEYAECFQKAAVLNHHPASFDLLETIRYDGDHYYLLEEHLQRLEHSAQYFGIPYEDTMVRGMVHQYASEFESPQRVRLLLSPHGILKVESAPLPATKRVRVGLAQHPVDATSPFLYHKTTHRVVYEAARAARPECDDVILWNAAGEVTESATANLVVRRGAEWLTPPIQCGLLPGTLRAALLREGKLTEAVLTKDELRDAEELRLINSVRGWIAVDWVD